MPMQTFQPQDLAVANGDRIQVPTTGGALALPPSEPPSLVSVFLRESWKRKRLLFTWSIATIAVTAVIVLVFAKPLYRAEGKFSYRPNYSRGAKPIYTPPNIQSAVQILKAPEVLEPVRQRRVPDVSKEEFAKNVRVEVSKQSEFIDVGYDHPDPEIAAAVANDLMTEGMKFFTDVRNQTTKDAVVQVSHDLRTARAQLDAAKEEFRKAHESRGIADLDVEQDTLKLAVTNIENQLREARMQQAKLRLEIKFLETRRDAPTDPTDAAFDDTFFPMLQSMMNELQSKMVNQKMVDEARFRLEALRKDESAFRDLVAKNIYPRTEYDKIVAEIKIHEATLKQAEETKQLREELQKRYDELKKKSVGGKPIRKPILEEIERLKKEEATLPGTIAVLNEELKEKKKAQVDLVALKRELGEKEDNVKLIWNRVQDFHAQLTDAAERRQDLNANDLRVHSPAAAGTTPYSTNAPKLGLALVGVSALMFIGYMVLFALPSATGAAAANAGAVPGLQRALVALVPYIPGAKGRLAGSETPSPPGEAPAPGDVAVAQPESAARALADRIVQEGVDPGGIVLFAPTEEQLQVAPVIGDLGEFFSQRGDRVLVFDARHAAETPEWAGPKAPTVANSVEGYLDGKAEAPSECFVPTAMNGVEYSRADLSSRVSGVLSAHRFRQLVEEMRERYSLVFLVAPPVSLDQGDPLLAMMAEGMVLVTETSANPVEVHAFLDTLCQQVPARLYGTLTVPRAA
jgi:uncharacterized protein involved in exopolysaccharide biosynthesis